MIHRHWRRAIRARFALAILSALALVGALLAAPAATAAPKPAATLGITAASDASFLGDLTGIPSTSIPTVLTAANKPFDVTLTISPAQNQATTVTLSTVSGSGTLSTTQVTIPAGATTVGPVTESYDTATPALRINASVPGNKKITGATTDPFRVESSLTFITGGSSSLTAGADGSLCTTVSANNPICGIVRLPNGTSSDHAIMTIGPCVTGTPHCAPGNVVTQFLADMTGYNSGDPASMTLVCDPSLCGKGGVNKYTALWSQSADGQLVASPACQKKGVLGQGQTYCTDYVSSSRSNSDQLLLVVLFDQDVRGTI